ncbi:U-box domain-containing protein 8-like [Impatiens glandulifera]|uniref:U-box domain-containing protein 8-like n=1 Tax=Impatiens glandulifera TaxID=253017 RepID=UPI001FB07F82|nr:U-box domain-containing protein 8-like [Impatiens glandulifera]
MATHLPDVFKCPISLEIMSDPVILSSGHTYDRSSIQRWLQSGHRTCPISKLPLSDPPSLIPNHALRSLISNYTTTVSIPHPENPQTLLSSLTSQYSPLDLKLNSLDQLTRLSKRDSGLRRRLTESGAVSAVLNCVASDNPVLQERALTLLLNLSLDDDNKVGLVAEGAIGRVVSALSSADASPDTRAVAATVLTSLAVVEVNKATIGAFPYAIKALTLLLSNGHSRERKEATTALYTLCSFPDNRRRAVEHGSVPILIGIAGSGLERAVALLGLLAKCKEGREEMVKVGDFVAVIVNVLRNGSLRGVQYALMTLNSVCCYSEDVCLEVLREEGVFEFCLGLLEDENEKVRRNASSLIQLLRGRNLSSLGE